MGRFATEEEKKIMSFHARDISLELIRTARAVLAKLRRQDPDAARSLRKNLRSQAENVAEGSRRMGRDRTQLYLTAAGSLDEALTELRVAEAFGDLAGSDIESTLELGDRLLGILWRLTHPR